ncbi:hypothetical protein [Bradyrhizobium sp. LA7.1]|uniref:hypothetical protein n=1 Tax=Bradyrhizobium sp. LA7.1 TaxID=3156324 RepID=UPI0033936BB5
MITRRLILAGAAALAFTTSASAVAPICDALTLYGSAANSGLCKSLGMSNHWVCELAQGSPDIHLTFNETTKLHITVRDRSPNCEGKSDLRSPNCEGKSDLRSPICEGKSDLTGAWNAEGHTLKLANGQPSVICKVNVQNYVYRLNAQPGMEGAGRRACIAAFNTAANNGRISIDAQSFFINLCKKDCAEDANKP